MIVKYPIWQALHYIINKYQRNEEKHNELTYFVNWKNTHSYENSWVKLITCKESIKIIKDNINKNYPRTVHK